jgi:tetratricopeptide (TPR) repeat protein
MKISASLLLIILLAAMPYADQIYSGNKKANQLYKKGEYGEALKMYDDLSVEAPSEPKIKMNKGSAQYQLGDLDKAEESYNQAAAGLKDKKALADLYYNLGNTQYMQGEQLAGQGKQEAMDKYKAALGNYIKSLDIKANNKDAKWNLQLASAKIKEMQNQQQQNKNDKNKNDKKDNKQNQNTDQNKDQNKDKNKDNNKDQKNKDQNKDNNKDKQDQDKQNQNSQNDKQDQQKPEPQPAQSKQEDMKKDEAKKLIELYSDDEHDLNKKPEKTGVAGQKRVDKDW